MSDSRPRIGLVLLAAGGSSRMGTPKQLMMFQGRTLLRHAAEEALGSRCDPIVVVLGAHAARLVREVAGLPVRVAHNVEWRAGMGASIRTGVEALLAGDEALEGVVIAVCDQPFCNAATIRMLVAMHARTGGRIVAASYGGVCGVPVLFDRELFPRLLALDGQEGARRVLQDHLEDVLPIPFPPGAVDVDTPEDVARLEALLDHHVVAQRPVNGSATGR